VGVVEPDSSIVYVLRFPPCLGGLLCFFPYNVFHRNGIWLHSVRPIVWVVAHREIDKRGIVVPFVLLVSIHFCPCGMCLGGLLSCLPWSRNLLLILSGSWVVAVIPGGQSFFLPLGSWGYGALYRCQSRRRWVCSLGGTIEYFRFVFPHLPTCLLVRLEGRIPQMLRVNPWSARTEGVGGGFVFFCVITVITNMNICGASPFS